jgi:protein-disulfide isomerase
MTTTRNFNYALWVLLIALIISVTAAAADKKALTRDQGDQILQQLQRLNDNFAKLTAPRPAGPPAGMKAKITIDVNRSMGLATAPLTLVEFTDYQCPYCNRWYMTTFIDIKKNWIDTGKLRFAVRDNPLPMHADAMGAAEAAHCGGAQGQFWQMGERMSMNPDKLNIQQFMSWMEDLEGNATVFRACMEAHAAKETIDADIVQAAKIGLTGTPGFVIGRSTAEGVDGETLMGGLPYPVFEQRLRDLLKVR